MNVCHFLFDCYGWCNHADSSHFLNLRRDPWEAPVFSLQKRPILILKKVAYLQFLNINIGRFCQL